MVMALRVLDAVSIGCNWAEIPSMRWLNRAMQRDNHGDQSWPTVAVTVHVASAVETGHRTAAMHPRKRAAVDGASDARKEVICNRNHAREHAAKRRIVKGRSTVAVRARAHEPDDPRDAPNTK